MIRQREQLLLLINNIGGFFIAKKWLIEGECNSKFFHLNAKFRKQKSTIVRLRDTSEIWIEDQEAIQNTFLHDFTNCFSS